jgi:LacI family transcriptional regulator
MRRTKEIAFAFPRYDHHERFIEGVLRYAAEHECEWSYITPAESASLSVMHLKGWPGDGVLAEICSEEEEQFARGLNMPVVNISSNLPTSQFPMVIANNYAFGELAADHLLEKGFPCFGFYGVDEVEYSRLRRAGFVDHLTLKRHTCALLEVTPTYGHPTIDWHRQHQVLANWIKSLSKPCGIFAISDYRARQVLDVCNQLNLDIPKEIGIIGVDNMTIICEHSVPSLSSIARNDILQGYRAAELLNQQLHGNISAVEPNMILPKGIVERGSTAFLVSDPRMLAVRDFLHNNLNANINIKTICRDVGVSRRWLESEFRKVFDESPHQYLRRQRLSLVRRILIEEPREKISSIASRTGFSSAKQLYATFLKEFNQSPRQFRRAASPFDEY